MSNILQKICADKRAHVDHVSKGMPFETVDRKARAASPPRGFIKALRTKVEGGGIGLIAEIKKASPSTGVIRADFDPAALAKAYAAGGAACLSVLTDAPYFKGRNEDLIAARAACALPVLRKDFMLDAWQVAEARGIGADCILLIAAALDDAAVTALHKAATGYGMDVLIEAHDETEMKRALKLAALSPAMSLIGINNRDLKTLKTDLATTERLAPLAPKDHLLVGESGIATPTDIARMQKAGVHCFLVGESLLKQEDVAAATKNLLEDRH
ncbi:MAG TPA: indole-3-glycerol phosphate synthase TrpC [Alphaproteobacteria bacterium]|nr:indole-3-glycerol phosphate synthase TrpC [Alphaproteobacteria bacterium]